jgi:TIGR04076 family protein
MTGGNFSEGMFKDWMNDKDSIIACCTDGIRPVVFEIRRV